MSDPTSRSPAADSPEPSPRADIPERAPERVIERDRVLALARLAHLDLAADEADRLTGDLASILAYVRQLEELDVSAVPPTAHVHIDQLPLREDEELPSLPRAAALAEAPRVQDDGFAVPAFVDEG